MGFGLGFWVKGFWSWLRDLGFRLVFLGLGFRDLAYGFGIWLRVLGLVPWNLA